MLETVHTATTLTAYNVAPDGNGNVVALVNAVDGTLDATYEYGPFGEPLRADVNPALGQPEKDALAANPIRYSSYYTDVESGLINFGHRYYDPGLGRFINRDPAEEAGGVNLYAFVGNDPANRWDSLGMGYRNNDGQWIPEPGDDNNGVWWIPYPYDFDPIRIFDDSRALGPNPPDLSQIPARTPVPRTLQDRVGELRRARTRLNRLDIAFGLLAPGVAARATTRVIIEGARDAAPAVAETVGADALAIGGTTIAAEAVIGYKVLTNLDVLAPITVGQSIYQRHVEPAPVMGPVPQAAMPPPRPPTNKKAPAGFPGDDPHEHHRFPQQFEPYFSSRGIDIEEFKTDVPQQWHTGEEIGIHPQGYNADWARFIAANPEASRAEILEQLTVLETKYGIAPIPNSPLPPSQNP